MNKSVHSAIVSISLALLASSAFAQLTRVPNTTLTNLPSQPPVFGYSATNAFGVTFTDPIAIATLPGETNRLFVVEQDGIIAVITNLAAPNRSVYLNITAKVLGGVPNGERGLLGLAFHPQYASNGFFYVFYTGNATTATPGGTNSMHDIIARFKVSDTNANVADTNETRILMQYDQADNHNGGDIHFGTDGYLYAGLGDEGDANDTRTNSQRITQDFFSAMLRIDVDKKPGNLTPNPHPSVTTNYLVPADNPFIGATNFNGSTVNSNLVRTEFWAVGLRNPWRWSFDPLTGHLYCGDVGQGAREEIDIITRGGNYGWNYREGFIQRPGSGSPPAGFVGINPILDYPHSDPQATNRGDVIIGGVVYRGNQLSQLVGAYIFADSYIPNVWLTRYDGTNATPKQWLFGESGIVAFGYDPRNGDILMANQGTDTIRRLIYTTNSTGTPLPPTLADTKVFSILTNLTPNPGIVPYDLNVPFWSDNAIKSRWFSLPNTNLDIGFNATANWSFPTGTVWIKHFELELTNGVASSRKRLETRLLVKNSGGLYGITYRWGNSLTNATLVADQGFEESFVINDGVGNTRTQVWHYPSRFECLVCHTPVAGFALGFNTAQLNRNFDQGNGPTNQIAALADAGYFSNSTANIHTLPALAPASDDAVSLEHRVRSYLAANCVQCHQPGGASQAMWDARISTTTDQAGLINGALFNNNGNTNNRVITPGSLTNSMLLTRLASFGSLHMPPLATSVTNAQAIALISAWITNDLPDYKTFADWQLQYFNSTNSADSLTNADADGDGNNNQLEFLTGSNPTNNTDSWKISITDSNPVAHINFLQLANRGFEVQFASNILSPIVWQPLDIPANAPFFSVTNRNAVVHDPATNASRFYRVRVFTP